METSAELVGRCQTIVENVPPDLRVFKPSVKSYHVQKGLTSTLVFLDTKGRIDGVPEGANQLRQLGAWLVWCDEFAFWDDPERAYAAMRPTIETSGAGGGKLVLVSTARAGSFMADIIRADAVWEKTLCEGLTLRFLTNGIHVLRCHYTADEEKRTVEWEQQARQGLVVNTDALWRQEYEIEWGSNEGALVYSLFDQSEHLRADLHPTPVRPILVGLDLTGLNPAAVIGQTVNGWGSVQVIGEFGMTGTSHDVYCQHLKEYLTTRFPDNQHIFYCDPAAWTRRDTDASTPVKQFKTAFGEDAPIRRGATDYASRHAAVNSRLTRRREHGGMVIDSAACPVLTEALITGYRYSDRQLQTGQWLQPQKNKFSHFVDALQYLLTGYDKHGISGARMLRGEEEDAWRRIQSEDGLNLWNQVMGNAHGGRSKITGY